MTDKSAREIILNAIGDTLDELPTASCRRATDPGVVWRHMLAASNPKEEGSE